MKKLFFLILFFIIVSGFVGPNDAISATLMLVFIFLLFYINSLVNNHGIYKKYCEFINESYFPLTINKLTSGDINYLFKIENDIIWPPIKKPSHSNKKKVLKSFIYKNAIKFKKKGVKLFQEKMLNVELRIENEKKQYNNQNNSGRYTNKDDGNEDFKNFYDFDLEQCFNILGIPNNSSISDIKKAYKEKISKTHPDKVSHLSKELQRLAQKEALKINLAYQKIMMNSKKA